MSYSYMYMYIHPFELHVTGFFLQPVSQAHYTIPVTIEGIVHNVFVIKRPGVDEFLKLMGEHYEVNKFTYELLRDI